VGKGVSQEELRKQSGGTKSLAELCKETLRHELLLL
jgi:hypothetical protein